MSTRILIARQFNIPKKGLIHVNDNQIQSDGFNFLDVEKALTPEAIQSFLQSKETSLAVLWKLLVDTIEGKIKLPEPVIVTTPGLDVAPAPKPRGRPKKTNV